MSDDMSDGRLDMTGLWHGTFAYPAYAGPTTPFVARIEESGGTLTGTIMEPNTMGWSSEELEAVLAGSRDGRSVDFTKTYDGSSDAAHAVDYVGRLSDDGNKVTGVWSLEVLDGTFEMHRDTAIEELVAAGAEEAEDAPMASQPTGTAAHPPAAARGGGGGACRSRSTRGGTASARPCPAARQAGR